MRHRHVKYRRWLAAIVLSATVAGGAMWLYSPGDITRAVTADSDAPSAQPAARDSARKPQGGSTAQTGPEHQTTATPAITARTPTTLGPDPFAASLEGTDIDGALKADASGRLIVDLGTRDFFDYFLSTVGEVSPDEALERIRTLAFASLPREAAEQAMALLDQYLDYKQQALAMQATPLDPTLRKDPAYQQQMLEKAFTDLKQLRQAVFSPDAHQAFFGMEEAYGEYTLETLAIARRTDLSDSAKTALIDWHRNQLPEPLLQTERRLLESNEENRQRMEIMKTADSPESAGQKLMDQGMSPDAAASVTSYLQEREDFDARYRQYREALARLRESGLADGDEAAQQARLLDQYFPDNKQHTWARLKMLGSNPP
ncbi:lipase secretion chaperone [Marinobacter sp. F4206]|uniref:lipase secretion chaperone n=1 Tax=Marinobacter sp. F4206 TaxID=2861777 RepID=UPI001C5DE2F0|nr:lipase secretion chaperone [Marinobacter sp. F4206]MBW4934608.1 lipase chaperone [Marinobacter sp. F4206]